MAGYRPKSLDELNNLYDKSRNAKNEIEKKASVLAAPVQTEAAEIPVVQPVEETAPEVAAQQSHTGEITGLVDDFIKNFGSNAPKGAVRPSTVAPTPIKAVSSPRSNEARPAQAQSNQPVQSASGDRTRLIRNSERNELFEDYKKVMDDEDDYETSRHKRNKKKGRRFFDKKSHAEVITQNEEESAEPEVVIPVEEVQATVDTPAEPEIPETLENIDAVIDMVLGVSAQQEEAAEPEAAEEPDEPVTEEPPAELPVTDEDLTEHDSIPEAEEQEASDEIPVYESSAEEEVPEQEDMPEPEAYEPGQDEPEENEVSSETLFVEPEKKSYAGKNILLVVLFFILLLATAVSAVKAFSGVNTDNLVLGKYRVFSARSNYEAADVKKGDLVVVTHDSIREGDVFAHKTGDGKYDLAKLDSVLNEENVVADNDGQKSIVLKNNLRGVLYKTYPAIGTFAAFVVSYYFYITGALLALAAILLIVIIFAFGKKNSSVAVLEDAEEASADNGDEYDANEADFRYLIQDDDIDENFEAYGNEDSEEDAGLPV